MGNMGCTEIGKFLRVVEIPGKLFKRSKKFLKEITLFCLLD